MSWWSKEKQAFVGPLYNRVTKSETKTQSWYTEEYTQRPRELQTLAVQCIKSDLEYQYGGLLKFAILLESTEEVIEHGRACVRLTFLVEYDHYEYVGPREGTVEIHKRIISPEVVAMKDKLGEILDREYRSGEMFIRLLGTGAVHRVGCYCCYGDGPDLNSEYRDRDDGGMEIVWTINFDFRLEDHV